jgi:hypothetical protein
MSQWHFGGIIQNLKRLKMDSCPICQRENLVTFYTQKDIPFFQNKTYPSLEAAKSVKVADISITQCSHCNFVFNRNFDPDELEYDSEYQNEQANSDYFQNHLKDVIGILSKNDLLNEKIVEVGCGKGYFLNLLRTKGIDIIGFDPVYEGSDPSIIKDRFCTKYQVNADLVILRHTLEHIQSPLEFLHIIADANKYKGKIYIEVPTFDWIVKNKAIEDIFYEHCNYFTIETLKMLFHQSECGYIFNGQYIYLIADLKNLKNNDFSKTSEIIYTDVFSDLFSKFQQLIKELSNLAIWGAGAKGSTFLNLLDPDCEHVKCVIDINPSKQQRYLARTGHLIISPSIVSEFDIKNIIIMNPNYYNEIQEYLRNPSINLLKLH